MERENCADRENVLVFWSLVFCLLGYGIIFFTFKFLIDFVNFLCAHIFFYPIFVGYSSLKMQIYVDTRTYPTLTSFSRSAHVFPWHYRRSVTLEIRNKKGKLSNSGFLEQERTRNILCKKKGTIKYHKCWVSWEQKRKN